MRIQLPKLHPKQQEIKDALLDHRYLVVNAGRRFGKSALGIDLLITFAITSNKHVAWFAPTYKQLLNVFEDCCNILVDVGRPDRQNKRIRLINDVTIDFWALDTNIADRIRGRKYGLGVIDESAFIPNLLDIFNRVITPTLMDYKGKCVFLSSPNGYNDHYELFNRAGQLEQWASHIATTYDNPYIPKDEIEQVKLLVPDKIFKAEILAQFIGEGKLFSNVLDVSICQEILEPERGHTYVFGIDLAFQHDYTVIAILDVFERKVVRYIRGQWELQLLASLIEQLSSQYKPDSIYIDATGMGIPIVQYLNPLGLPLRPITFTAETKRHLIHYLMLQMEQKTIQLSNKKESITEFSLYEEKNGKYNAPQGHHDDIVIACALAVWGLRNYR